MLLIYILNKLSIKIPEGSEVLIDYASGVLILSLIALLSFINVVGYFLSLHLIQRYDIKKKYPKFNKIISFYENRTLFFILLEILICIFCLLFLIISALYCVNKFIFNLLNINDY